MVQKDIVLGHRVSKNGIEVDKANIEVIDKLSPPTSLKGITSFLGHAGFYRRFIKAFSKVAKPLCSLLEHDKPFHFDKDCLQAFRQLKKALITTPDILHQIKHLQIIPTGIRVKSMFKPFTDIL